MKKLSEVISNPTQKNLFSNRANPLRHDHKRNDNNQIRRLQQLLEEERAKYQKLQVEKDDEISSLNEEINKLKRDFDTQREDFKRRQQQQELHRSMDSVSTINERIDDESRGNTRI